MRVNNVLLLNRSNLEDQLDNQGILEVAEQLIERMKEHVQYIAKGVYEQFVIDVKLVVDNVLKNITAHFIVHEDEDERYQEESEGLKYILFQDVTTTEKG